MVKKVAPGSNTCCVPVTTKIQWFGERNVSTKVYKEDED